MKKTTTALLALIAVLLLVTESARAQTLCDEEFADVNWTDEEVVDTNGGGTYTAQQQMNNGNPNAHRHGTHTLQSSTLIRIAHLRTGFGHDPATRGVISQVTITFDAKVFDGSGACGDTTLRLGMGPAIQQAASYFSVLNSTINNTQDWWSLSFGPFGASDFGLVLDDGGIDFNVNPDFSVNGAPVEFGFFSNNSTGNPNPNCIRVWGIDNYCITLSPFPCPWDCEVTPDGNVGINDFLDLLAQWGSPGSCDFDGGGVGITNFLELLANWGPCP